MLHSVYNLYRYPQFNAIGGWTDGAGIQSEKEPKGGLPDDVLHERLAAAARMPERVQVLPAKPFGGRSAAAQADLRRNSGEGCGEVLEGAGVVKYEPERHHRRSIRRKGYDYSQAGAYFVTIVTRNRECLFGEVVDGQMRLNDAGRMVEQWGLEMNRKFPTMETDEYIVMPNHILC